VDTSVSLLDALRGGSDEQSWRRLVDLYGPLLRGWLKRHGATPQDADDAVQDVLAVVVRKLPAFERQPRTGSFRAWLRTITVNCLREQWRRGQRQPAAVGGSDFGLMIDQLEDPHSGLSHVTFD
jgi:RNA polymerase sigma-70 factor (ECF subfamily)